MSQSSEKTTGWTTEESWFYFQQKQLQHFWSETARQALSYQNSVVVAVKAGG
jgi:hypothetical protein